MDAMSGAGLTHVPSKYSVAQTLDRLESLARARGQIVFARIDHSGEATKAGLALRPMQLLILGSPTAGTPLMVAAPTIGIDLPLKALAWEDANGKVWLSSNTSTYLQERHRVPPDLMKNIAGLGALIEEAMK
jgi:uncharacterized protein (DUF302 family)